MCLGISCTNRPGKSAVKSTDRPAMTLAVDFGRKATIQTNKQKHTRILKLHIIRFVPGGYHTSSVMHKNADNNKKTHQ